MPKKQHLPLYKAFREHGVDNFFIELLEKCPCNGKDELRKKEGAYIQTLKQTLNVRVAGRTKSEYYNDNKETTKAYYIDNRENFSHKAKEHYIDNEESIREHKKHYYGNNKESIKEKNNTQKITDFF